MNTQLHNNPAVKPYTVPDAKKAVTVNGQVRTGEFPQGEYVLTNYLCGKAVRQSETVNLKFDDFKVVEYLIESNGFHHWLCRQTYQVLITKIQIS